MNKIPNEELVEYITKEVMRILNNKQKDSNCVSDKPGALILGSAEKLPSEVLAGINPFNIDDYALHGDIEKYCCLYITEISLAQLSDIALGRDERPYQCAVIKAILSGKKVYLLAEALTYRRFARTAKKAYYDMLAGYEEKLAASGVCIIPAANLLDEAGTGPMKPNPAGETIDCTDKVITGKRAEELCRNREGAVNLKKGTIITPLAKDAFGAAKIRINFV